MFIKNLHTKFLVYLTKKKEENKIQVTGYIKKKPQKLWFFLVSDFDTQLERICFLTLHTGLDQILCRNPIEKGCCCDNIFFFSLSSLRCLFFCCVSIAVIFCQDKKQEKKTRETNLNFFASWLCVCVWVCDVDLESSDLYTRRRPARNETIKGTGRVFVQFFIFIRVMRVLFRVFCIMLDSARLLLLARRTPLSSFTAASHCTALHTRNHMKGSL